MGPKFSKRIPSNKDSNNAAMYGKSIYGPVSIHFAQFKMSDKVLEYIQQEDLFSMDHSQVERVGYCKAIDYPDIPEHKYYEAYMHSLPTNDIYTSIHSRYGHSFDKPCAPLRLTAFCEALRRVNASWKELTMKRLRQLLPSNPAEVILKMLEEDRHFAGG